ncbi:MAG TPA: S24/S26 family peptidase [Thermoanaerobaculia bacterium]|nr:S24/S26 family peptidase [Thermoanaerobaculia bacterium]
MNLAAFRFLRELAREERVTLRVRGDCMQPDIAPGDAVTVRRRRLYLPGDVIVFRTPAGDLVAHRVLGYRGRSLVTQGDHCLLHDAPVAREAIIGAVEGLRIELRDRAAALARFTRLVARRLTR